MATKLGKVEKLALQYEELKKLERWHRAKSRRQYHAGTLKKLRRVTKSLKNAVAKL